MSASSHGRTAPLPIVSRGTALGVARSVNGLTPPIIAWRGASGDHPASRTIGGARHEREVLMEHRAGIERWTIAVFGWAVVTAIVAPVAGRTHVWLAVLVAL